MLGFKKSKQNFKKYYKLAFFAVLFLISLEFIFIKAVKAGGNVYDFSQIVDSVSVQLAIDSDNPQWSQTNYIRLGKDATLDITAQSTLVSLPNNAPSLTFGTDKMFISGWTTNATIDSWEFMVDGADDPTGGGIDCNDMTDHSTKYFSCGLPRGHAIGTQGNVVVPGGVLFRNANSDQQAADHYFKVIGTSIWSAAVNSNDNKTYCSPASPSPDSSGLLGRCWLVVYPGIKAGSINPLFKQYGYRIYVDMYDTQAQATAASASSPPSDVPSTTPVQGNGYSDTVANNTLLGLVNKLVNIIVLIINGLIYSIFSIILAPILQAVLSIRVSSDAFVNVIYVGWVEIRNFCNYFFIIALITIGIATVLRLESYHYKKLLVQIVLAALLVNFSLVIGQSILTVADTMQNTFLPANRTAIVNLGKTLMWTNVPGLTDQSISASGSFDQTFQLVFDVSMACGSFMVFAAITVFLVIRMVALWILLMISPVAYVAGVLPSTESARSQWWSTFLKYAFFTPIMALFLNIAAVISTTLNSSLVNVSAAFIGSNSPDLSGLVLKVVAQVLLLVFLLASLMVAEKFSIYGADKVTDIAKKGMFAPFKGVAGLGKVAGGYAGRKWNEITADKVRGHGEKVGLGRAIAFAALNPKAFASGWKKDRDAKTERAKHMAEAAGLETVEQRFGNVKDFFKGGYKRLPHVQQHEKEEEDEKAKHFQNMSREKVAAQAAKIAKLGDDADGRAYKRGIIKLAMSKGYVDDIIDEAGNTQEGRDLIEKMIKAGNLTADDMGDVIQEAELDSHGHPVIDPATGQPKMKDVPGSDGKPLHKLAYNNRTRRALYKSMFGDDGHGGLKDPAAGRLITEEGEAEGKATGHYEYMTDMFYNQKTGHHEFYKMAGDDPHFHGTHEQSLVSEGEGKMAGAEIAKLGSRDAAKVAWHSMMSNDGRYFSKDFFQKVTKAFVENGQYMQERTANMLLTGTTDEKKLSGIRKKFIETGELDLNSLPQEQRDLTKKRIKEMWDTDKDATMAVFAKFAGQAQGNRGDSFRKSMADPKNSPSNAPRPVRMDFGSGMVNL